MHHRPAFAASALLSLSLLGCGGDGPTHGGNPPPPAGPQLSSVSPAAITPGATATLTGSGFSTVAGGNQVTIGGRPASVVTASATTLTVTVPCLLSGSAAVVVTADGRASAALNHPLQGNVRTLAVGQAALVDAAQTGCTELASVGGAARYVVAVYNTSTTATSASGMQLSGDGAASPQGVLARPALARTAAPGPAPSFAAAVRDAAERVADQRHAELLERDRAAYARLHARFADDPRMRARRSVSRAVAPPPATRAFRVANINNSSICGDYFPVNATRVYYNGKVAIYEDNANLITTTHPSLGASMQQYYDRIGDQFNADMEPIIHANYGDLLRRDAETDNNGVMVALFTQAINDHIPSVAGFVVSCDQYPNDEGATQPINTASNYGEFFYAYVPTVTDVGYNAFTPDSWYRTIRSTFIHETKHVASQAARVANGASTWEQSWLEEGTARHAEELWARASVYGVAWKGNTGYGSAAAPGSLYCDVRPSWPECSATNPRRPSYNMVRHLGTGGLWEFLGNPSGLSPFGRASDDAGASFYGSAWSLIRYAIDRYGSSEAAFLGGLNQAVSSGMNNLSAQAGVSPEQLQGEWALALYADDYPGIASPAPELRFPTWNLRDIYAGLKADFPAAYGRATPIVAEPIAFGPLTALSATTISGGGVKYYDLSGTQSAAQLLRLEGTGGVPVPATLRVAIARLQ